MEQKIILEGIHAMLEEIRDNLKKNPEVETIKSKLNTIEKVCNEFAGQKFVTEDVLAQFLACTLQKIAEMNEKQEEKIIEWNQNILAYCESNMKICDRQLELITEILKKLTEKMKYRLLLPWL